MPLQRLKKWALVWLSFGTNVQLFRTHLHVYTGGGNYDSIAQHQSGVDDVYSLNRSLVIAMGELRGGEEAWETLYEQVLDPNMADLALLTTNNFTLYPNSTLVKRAKYVWYYDQYQDWSDALDLVNGTGWRTTHLPKFPRKQSQSILFGGIKGFGGSGMIIFVMRYFLSQYIRENGILDKYDQFVVTRPDQYYLCQHPFVLLFPTSGPCCHEHDNTIWVPKGEEWGGLTDRHLVVGSENLLDALDIIPQLIMKPFSFNHNIHHNTERFVKHVWAEKKLTVKQFNRPMFLVARKSENPWRISSMKVEGAPGLFAKYNTELLEAQHGCRNL